MTAFLIICGVVLFLLVGYVVSVRIVNGILFERFFHRVRTDGSTDLTDEHYKPVIEIIERSKKRLAEYKKEEIRVESSDGVALVADYYDVGGRNTAVFMHGMHTSPLNNFARHAALFLEKGYNVLIPDQRAHGRSGGEYCTYGIKESDDLIKWIEFAGKTASGIVVYGISLGGATVAYAAGKIESEKVKVLCVDCGFISYEEMVRGNASTSKIPPFLYRRYLKTTVKKKIGVDLTAVSAEPSLKKTKIPTAFIYGKADAVVPVTTGERAYEICGADKIGIFVDGAGHTTAMLVGGKDAEDKLFGFIEKHVKGE